MSEICHILVRKFDGRRVFKGVGGFVLPVNHNLGDRDTTSEYNESVVSRDVPKFCFIQD